MLKPEGQEIFKPEKINEYEQVLIFVQRGNDLDTCAGALAIAKVFKEKFPEKYCKIVGLNKLKNSFLKDIDKYGFYKQEELEEKKTLGILVDVNSPSQIIRLDLLNFCTHFLIIDHHAWDEMDEIFKDSTKKKIICNHSYQEFSSCCEIIWKLLNDNSWKITKDIAEILFMGLYADNQGFMSSTTNSKTFKAIGEMMEYGVEVQRIIKLFRQNTYENIKIFAQLIKDYSQKEKNLLILNLNSEAVFKHFPWNFYRNKNGKLRQKKLLTFPLVLAQQTIKANTYIFIHYSLFDPLNSDKKFVFVVLDKPNIELERILLINKFKKHRNRWSREITFKEILGILEKHKDIFTI